MVKRIRLSLPRDCSTLIRIQTFLHTIILLVKDINDPMTCISVKSAFYYGGGEEGGEGSIQLSEWQTFQFVMIIIVQTASLKCLCLVSLLVLLNLSSKLFVCFMIPGISSLATVIMFCMSQRSTRRNDISTINCY